MLGVGNEDLVVAVARQVFRFQDACLNAGSPERPIAYATKFANNMDNTLAATYTAYVRLR